MSTRSTLASADSDLRTSSHPATRGDITRTCWLARKSQIHLRHTRSYSPHPSPPILCSVYFLLAVCFNIRNGPRPSHRALDVASVVLTGLEDRVSRIGRVDGDHVADPGYHRRWRTHRCALEQSVVTPLDHFGSRRLGYHRKSDRQILRCNIESNEFHYTSDPIDRSLVVSRFTVLYTQLRSVRLLFKA